MSGGSRFGAGVLLVVGSFKHVIPMGKKQHS